MRVAIVLAAGSSTRFGSAKLLARLHGRPLLLHAIDRAREATAARILVVAGARWSRVTRLVDRDIILVRARRYKEGLSASLAAGLAALRPIDRELILFLADMPFARMPPMRLRAGIDAIRPEVAGKPGHPMLVRAGVARRLGGKGDRGLAAMLDPRRIGAVRGEYGNFIDIDTRAAFRAGARRRPLR